MKWKLTINLYIKVEVIAGGVSWIVKAVTSDC